MTKKCMIVDDVTVSRYASRVAVEALGLEVAEADSVDACLEGLKGNRFDVFIIDWHLRRDSGLDLIQKIRKTPGHEGSIIIVCSGIEGVGAGKQALDAGANGFVVKPTTQQNITAEFNRLGVSVR